jgi:hypothetical protein
MSFAECLGHSAKKASLVVLELEPVKLIFIGSSP